MEKDITRGESELSPKAAQEMIANWDALRKMKASSSNPALRVYMRALKHFADFPGAGEESEVATDTDYTDEEWGEMTDESEDEREGMPTPADLASGDKNWTTDDVNIKNELKKTTDRVKIKNELKKMKVINSNYYDQFTRRKQEPILSQREKQQLIREEAVMSVGFGRKYKKPEEEESPPLRPRAAAVLPKRKDAPQREAAKKASEPSNPDSPRKAMPLSLNTFGDEHEARFTKGGRGHTADPDHLTQKTEWRAIGTPRVELQEKPVRVRVSAHVLYRCIWFSACVIYSVQLVNSCTCRHGKRQVGCVLGCMFASNMCHAYMWQIQNGA
eukprot:Platyproteum_vivax@DN6563_c0_g1_i1.p1